MTGPDQSSPPGTEAKHYLVFAPGTKPLGRETDMRMTEAFANLVGATSHWMDLIIRLADPAKVQKPQDLWRRVRIVPELHTLKSLDNSRFGCSGHAWPLNQDGTGDGEELLFSATFKIVDGAPGDILGELSITA